MNLMTFALVALMGTLPQNNLNSGDNPIGGDPIDKRLSIPRVRKWQEGQVIMIRVPVAEPGKELMTTIAFPEERIDTAITGWAEGSITATAKKGLLFVRLPSPGEGHLNVIGGSGTHYLIYLKGVEPRVPSSFDPYVKIMRQDEQPATKTEKVRMKYARPIGSLELIRAMRLGKKPEGARILRARGEVAYKSGRVSISLRYVYKHDSYVGRIFEITNLTDKRQPLDATRFRGKGDILLLSALRENVLEPGGTTRLYVVFWKE